MEAEAKRRSDEDAKLQADVVARQAKLDYGAELERQMQERETVRAREKTAQFNPPPQRFGVGALPGLSTAPAPRANARAEQMNMARQAAAAAHPGAPGGPGSAFTHPYAPSPYSSRAPPQQGGGADYDAFATQRQPQQQRWAEQVPQPSHREWAPNMNDMRGGGQQPWEVPLPPRAPEQMPWHGQTNTNVNAAPGPSEGMWGPAPVDDAATKKAAYALDLEGQLAADRDRKLASKRELARADATLERGNLEHERRVASRRAMGGAGEPLRAADGRTIASLRGASPPPRAAVTFDGDRDRERDGSVAPRADLWADEPVGGPGQGVWGQGQGQGLGAGPGIGAIPYRSSSPPRGRSAYSRGTGADLRAGLSPDQITRKMAQRQEIAVALEAQMGQRIQAKADDARRAAREEAELEDRIAREREQITATFKREEDEKKAKEEALRKEALDEQIAYKVRQKAVEEEGERVINARENAKLDKQRKEIADQYSREQGGGGVGGGKRAAGGVSPVPSPPGPGGGGGGGGGPFSAPTIPGGALLRSPPRPSPRNGGDGELFGPTSPPPFPGEPSLADMLGNRRPTGPPVTDYGSGGGGGGGFMPMQGGGGSNDYDPYAQQQQQQQQQMQMHHSGFLPIVSQQQGGGGWGGHPMMLPAQQMMGPPASDPALPLRLRQAEGELERLRFALTALQMQQSDAAFVQGLERVGLSRTVGGDGVGIAPNNHALAAVAAAHAAAAGRMAGADSDSDSNVKSYRNSGSVSDRRVAELLSDVPGLILPGAPSSRAPLVADSWKDPLAESLRGTSRMQMQPLTMGATRPGRGAGSWVPSEAENIVVCADPMRAFPELGLGGNGPRGESRGSAASLTGSAQSMRGESRFMADGMGGVFSPGMTVDEHIGVSTANRAPVRRALVTDLPEVQMPPILNNRNSNNNIRNLPTVRERETTPIDIDSAADMTGLPDLMTDIYGSSFADIDRAVAARDAAIVGYESTLTNEELVMGERRKKAPVESIPSKKLVASAAAAPAPAPRNILEEVDAILRGDPPEAPTAAPPARRLRSNNTAGAHDLDSDMEPLRGMPKAHLNGPDELDLFADISMRAGAALPYAPARQNNALDESFAPDDFMRAARLPADRDSDRDHRDRDRDVNSAARGFGGSPESDAMSMHSDYVIHPRGPRAGLVTPPAVRATTVDSAGTVFSTDAGVIARENAVRVRKLQAMGVIDKIDALSLQGGIEASLPYLRPGGRTLANVAATTTSNTNSNRGEGGGGGGSPRVQAVQAAGTGQAWCPPSPVRRRAPHPMSQKCPQKHTPPQNTSRLSATRLSEGVALSLLPSQKAFVHIRLCLTFPRALSAAMNMSASVNVSVNLSVSVSATMRALVGAVVATTAIGNPSKSHYLRVVRRAVRAAMNLAANATIVTCTMTAAKAARSALRRVAGLNQ